MLNGSSAITLSPSNGRRNLVACTCGDREPVVLEIVDAARQFDVAIINHAPDVRSYRDVPVECHFESRGHKWVNLQRLLKAADLLDRYDYFWFPDDDIGASAAGVNLLFEIARREGLQLCQPSLTHDSYFSWTVTRHCPGRDVRRTNFVEIMCPLFRADALRTCLPTFNLTESGWGLDFLWPALLDRDGIGVVHAVQVRHTLPVRSFTWHLDNGLTPPEEMALLLRTYGITPITPAELEG